MLSVFIAIKTLDAQNIRFDHFDTRKGLSQNNINSLVVDSIGYIWIGTLEGVTRFDGTNFKVFQSLPGTRNTLKGNYIDVLSACPNGNLWVHSQNGGMNLYDAKNEKFLLFPDSCFSPANIDNITSMVSNSDTCLWFTNRNNLYKFSLQTQHTTKLNTPFDGGYITHGLDRKLLYFGKGGVYEFDENVNGESSIKQFVDKPVRIISSTFNDSLVVVCTESLMILNLNSGKIKFLGAIEKLKGIHKNTTISSAAGYNNEIWLGLNDGLILIHYQDSIQDVMKFSYDPYNNYSFHGKDANSLTFDRAGNLWIGTSKYGINLYCRRKNLFEHHQISMLSKADQEIDPVRSICKTSDGSVWIGFDRLGLARTYPDKRQVIYETIHFPGNHTKPIEHIRSLYEDSKGNFWIGTSKGLCHFNALKDQVESVSLAYVWEWPATCYFMKEFDPGKLTITNSLGIGVVDLEKKTLKMLPFEIPSSYAIRSIVRDKRQNYWLAVDNSGLFKLNPDMKVKQFTRGKDELTNDKLYTLKIVNDTLWIASSNGIVAFDIKKEKVVSSYFEHNGLSNNLTYSIIDEPGYLWISTNSGISRMRLTDKYFENYLLDDLFMDDAFYKDRDGVIYFGGYDGYISFNPKTFHYASVIPKPTLTQLTVNNQQVAVGEKVGKRTILPASLQNIQQLKMNYGSNSFSLAFDAFPFNYPDRAYFRYRLVGLSDKWMNAAKNENRAVFTNLPPGDYSFEVEASLNGRNWSEAAPLPIQIIPPFWRQLWFQIVFTSIILILGVIFFLMRIYSIKKWNLQLETKVAEQTKSIENQKNRIIAQKEEMVNLSNRLHEADQAKLKFYTNVSHEFRTPLTIMMGNLESLKEQGVNQYLLTNVRRSTERLFRLVNQFIDLRRYDQGELKLEIYRINIVSFTKEIMEHFRELAARKNINLQIEKTNDEILLWLDRDKTDKILYNLLSNAIKYTENGGTVLISFNSKEEGLELNITDTGCGISEEELQTIFSSFYRGKKTSFTTDGYGIGLTLVKALADAQKATIECKSQEGIGTTFSILFKWGKQHFAETDFVTDEMIPIKHEPETLPLPVLKPERLSSDEILLVEDNPELLDYLSTLLGKYYKIQTATHGRNALKILKKNQPELIITDLMMPVMDGMEFSKIVRENPETRFIPIIILSAKTDVNAKIEGFQINIDDYIEKPFHPNLLLARVNNILEKRNEIRNNAEKLIVKPKGKGTDNKNNKIFFEKILIALDKNLSNSNYTADDLSAELGMSRVTFYRKMKSINDEAPGEFIRKYRLRRAATLILENNKTIGEIGNEVGFQSLSHFRKSFKEEFGVSPSQYINSL